MAEYKVNADFLVNVSAFVEADSEEEARRKAVTAILNHDCEWQDAIQEPKINWVEIDEDDLYDSDRLCHFCGQDSCDCDLL